MTGMDRPGERSHVVICIPTSREASEVGQTLGSLSAQQFTRIDPPRMSVVLVDNRPEERRDLASAVPAGLDVTIVEETRRGIPYARNAGLEALPADADFVAFIDDDEIASSLWLETLLVDLHRFDADVVRGSIVPILPPDTPAWMARSNLFERKRYPSGTRRPTASTNNTLARASLFTTDGLRFDTSRPRASGTDNALFRSAAARGARIVWSDEAVVFDRLPPDRTTLRWLVRRAFRTGNNSAVVIAGRSSSPLTISRQVGRAAAHAVRGGGWLVIAVVRGRAAIVRSLQSFARSAGILSGVVGYRFDDYAEGPARRDARDDA